MARSPYGAGGGDIFLNHILKELFGGETREEKEDKEIRRQANRLSLANQKLNTQLADVSILDSFINNASNDAEFKLANQTGDNILEKAISGGYSPTVIASIESKNLQIDEDTALYNQYKLGVEQVHSMMVDGEFEDFDINNLTYTDVASKVRDVSRLQHMINLGHEKKYSYNYKKTHSSVIKQRLDEYSKELDAGLFFRIDKAKGKIPPDALNAIASGEVELLEKIKNREVSNSRQNFNTHSTRYSSLNKLKMDADSQSSGEGSDGSTTWVKNPDGDMEIFPDTMMKDLEDKGALDSYLQAIEGDPMLYQAFMNARGKSVTIDYDLYSNLLDSQMRFESSNIKDANSIHFDWTGNNVEQFREAPDYSSVIETGYTPSTTPPSTTPPSTTPPPTPGEKMSRGTITKPPISKSRFPQMQEEIMDIISPHKEKIVSDAKRNNPDLIKEASSKATKKYNPAMEKAISKIDAKRNKELEKMEFWAFPTQKIRAKKIKEVNKKYDNRISQVRSKYYKPKDADISVKEPTVDEIYNEMPIFELLLDNKIDFNYYGISKENQRLLRQLVSDYKDARLSTSF